MRRAEDGSVFASRQIDFRRANRFNRFRCFGIRVQRRGAVLSIRHRPQKRAAPLFSLFPAMGYGAEAAPEWKSRKICQFCTRHCELASGHMLPHFALSWGHESPMITYRPCPFGKAAGRAWRASLYPPFQVAGYGAEAPCSPIALALLAKRRAEHGALPSVPLS